MRLRSSVPSPQWLLGIWCPLGMEVTLEPLCFCGHGTKCLCSLWKTCDCFGKFCPRPSSMQLVLGRGSQRWQRRELCCRELSCSFHKGKDCTLWLAFCRHPGRGHLCQAGYSMSSAVSPSPPAPLTASGTGMGGGDSTGPHRGEINCSKVVHSTIKTSWRLFVVL